MFLFKYKIKTIYTFLELCEQGAALRFLFFLFDPRGQSVTFSSCIGQITLQISRSDLTIWNSENQNLCLHFSDFWLTIWMEVKVSV